MQDNIIAWNVENWITVVLMVAIGFALIALVSQGIKTSRAAGAASGASGMNNTPLG